MCRLERWSSRQLQERIKSMLFERTAISRKPEETIRHDLNTLKEEERISPNLLLKDPYVLDFLGLSDCYLEKDLEDAILREIENFPRIGSWIQLRRPAEATSDRSRRLSESFGVWWSSTLRSGISARNIKARWSCICAGWKNTNRNPTNRFPWNHSVRG